MANIIDETRVARPYGLDGISEEQIAQHWALYEGYLKNASALSEKLSQFSKAEKFGVEFSELKRRWGFETNGVALHEYYFEALKGGGAPPSEAAQMTKFLKKAFGGFEAWRKEFIAVGKMRGTGWAILYLDPRSLALTNAWIASHEVGHPAGCVPLLVMDVWEHAYMVDWGASGRSEYIEAFLKNVDWAKVERRLLAGLGSYATENTRRR